jgi:hypothetical protein
VKIKLVNDKSPIGVDDMKVSWVTRGRNCSKFPDGKVIGRMISHLLEMPIELVKHIFDVLSDNCTTHGGSSVLPSLL